MYAMLAANQRCTSNHTQSYYGTDAHHAKPGKRVTPAEFGAGKNFILSFRHVFPFSIATVKCGLLKTKINVVKVGYEKWKIDAASRALRNTDVLHTVRSVI